MAKIQRIVAVFLVLVSLALGWYAWEVGKRAVAPQPVSAVPAGVAVAVAAKPLPAGEPITADGVKLEFHPTRPKTAFEHASAVVGKVPAENISVGEAILLKNLIGGEGGFAHEVQHGERALGLRVDEVSGVGSRLVPKDVVDVYVTFKRSGEEVAESQARLLLPDIRVLAVGSRSGQSRDEGPLAKQPLEMPRTVVLAVPAKEVSRLVLAAETGRVTLALKNPAEGKVVPLNEAERATLSERLSDASKATLPALAGPGRAPAAGPSRLALPAALVPARMPERGVEVIRGLGNGQSGGVQ